MVFLKSHTDYVLGSTEFIRCFSHGQKLLIYSFKKETPTKGKKKKYPYLTASYFKCHQKLP